MSAKYFASHGFSGTGQLLYIIKKKITETLWSQVVFSLNFKIPSCKISTFVNPKMSRHKEMMWGNPLVQVHQGSLQNIAANTGVFGNDYAAMDNRNHFNGSS